MVYAGGGAARAFGASRRAHREPSCECKGSQVSVALPRSNHRPVTEHLSSLARALLIACISHPRGSPCRGGAQQTVALLPNISSGSVGAATGGSFGPLAQHPRPLSDFQWEVWPLAAMACAAHGRRCRMHRRREAAKTSHGEILCQEQVRSRALVSRHSPIAIRHSAAVT